MNKTHLYINQHTSIREYFNYKIMFNKFYFEIFEKKIKWSRVINE